MKRTDNSDWGLVALFLQKLAEGRACLGCGAKYEPHGRDSRYILFAAKYCEKCIDDKEKNGEPFFSDGPDIKAEPYDEPSGE